VTAKTTTKKTQTLAQLIGHNVAHSRNRAGWTDARYRRAALKKRNRAKHRAACRGGR
jgi:hypothetical protein